MLDAAGSSGVPPSGSNITAAMTVPTASSIATPSATSAVDCSRWSHEPDLELVPRMACSMGVAQGTPPGTVIPGMTGMPPGMPGPGGMPVPGATVTPAGGGT